MIGFNEFTDNKEWLKQILSWQTPKGCYSWTNKNSKRHKRYDKIMDDDCSLHKTSMALGSIAVNIRDSLMDFFKRLDSQYMIH